MKRFQIIISDLKRQLPYLARALDIVWQAAGVYTVVWFVLIVIRGLLPIAVVSLTKMVVDDIVQIVSTDSSFTTENLIVLFLWASATLSQTTMGNIIQWLSLAQGLKIQDHISGLIQEKAVSLNLSFFDRTESYDKLYRARADARSHPQQLITNIGGLIQNALTLFGLMVLLATYSIWLLPLLVVITLPTLWVTIRHTRRFYKWRLRHTLDERRSNYYEFLLLDANPAAELRIFGLHDYFRKSYRDLRDNLRHERIQLERNNVIFNVAATLFSFGASLFVMVWMGERVIRGVASVGDLAAFYQIFNQGQSSTRAMMRTLGGVYQNMSFLENFYEFIDLELDLTESEQQSKDLDLPLQKGIRFENVSFSYPSSDRLVFKDFSWTIPAGKVVALVGENGEGKTTLMKLLCRLYNPTEGRVLWDDVDLQKIDTKTIWQAVTILFQAPHPYQASIRDNIRFGDINGRQDDEAIHEAAYAAGFESIIERLPEGYDTVLGKMFGKEDLSGGQWQRLALARAFMRQSDVIILDEPTSAMDAWSEAEWLNRLRNVIEGRTTIMITHRFTTAMHADVIYLIQNNEIVESGSHDELIASGGRYATSWHKQMSGQHLQYHSEDKPPKN